MASHPVLSFPKAGISSNQSNAVIPKIWHQWHPIQFSSFPKAGISGIPSSVVIPKIWRQAARPK
eukprot:3479518-Amphidinium_carterae.1